MTYLPVIGASILSGSRQQQKCENCNGATATHFIYQGKSYFDRYELNIYFSAKYVTRVCNDCKNTMMRKYSEDQYCKLYTYDIFDEEASKILAYNDVLYSLELLYEDEKEQRYCILRSFN